MGDNNNQKKPEPVKLGDTARIDRRNTLLARIEAALLSDKLKLEEAGATGTDPYNSGTRASAAAGAWSAKRPR